MCSIDTGLASGPTDSALYEPHCERFTTGHCNGKVGRSISTTSVAIELDQPLVADPEVMRDLVEHDVPDLAA